MLTGAVRRIDHVAVVVRSIDTTLAFYRDVLGLHPARTLDYPREGVKIAFIPLGGPGGSDIELLEVIDPASNIARFLEKRGEGLHHICLEVPDIERALSELQTNGVALLDATPRPTAEGRGVFIHPKAASGVLLELVQRDTPTTVEEDGQ